MHQFELNYNALNHLYVLSQGLIWPVHPLQSPKTEKPDGPGVLDGTCLGRKARMDWSSPPGAPSQQVPGEVGAHTRGTALTALRFANSLLTSDAFSSRSLSKPWHQDPRDGLGKLWAAEAKTWLQKITLLLLSCGDASLAYIHLWECLWSCLQRCPGSAGWSSCPAPAHRLTGSQNLPNLTHLVHVRRHVTTRLTWNRSCHPSFACSLNKLKISFLGPKGFKFPSFIARRVPGYWLGWVVCLLFLWVKLCHQAAQEARLPCHPWILHWMKVWIAPAAILCSSWTQKSFLPVEHPLPPGDSICVPHKSVVSFCPCSGHEGALQKTGDETSFLRGKRSKIHGCSECFNHADH